MADPGGGGDEEEGGDGQTDVPQGDPPRRAPDRPGVRRRRNLTQRLEDQLEDGGELTGSTDLMVAGGPDHTVRLTGGFLSSTGGPAKKLFNLLSDLVRFVEATFPKAEPELRSVFARASIDVTFHVPQREADVAQAWREYEVDEESLEGLPDTTIALASAVDVLALPPEEAAAEARRISGETAVTLKSFALELYEGDVSLLVPRAPTITAETFEIATPGWADQVVRHLDAAEELQPEVVTIVGVLQGANSGGAGQFEIKTDERLQIDRRLGSRLRPGATIGGRLTTRARNQIRKDNLWDTHVQGDVRIVRRRQGRSVRVESRELVAVRPRPGTRGGE
jgi:hypothetical protein